MSWHYLQGQEAEFWEGSSLDGAPSALSRLIPTADASCSPDNETESLNPSQSGMTSKPSTGDHGEDTSMSSQEDFPAKTSPALAKEQESTENDLGFGGKWRELSVKYDRDMHSWRTHRCLFDEVLPWSSVTLPKWGMTRGGACWELGTSARLIEGIGSGYLPTPVKYDATPGGPNNHYNGLGHMAKFNMWPTPCASDGGKGGRGELLGMIRGTKGYRGKQGLWPTPTSSMMTVGDLEQARFAGNDPRRPSYEEANKKGGQLNPTWVEWLMGWPIEWTDLKPLEMDKFRQWLRLHGRS